MLPAEMQQPLGQEQFDPAIRPVAPATLPASLSPDRIEHFPPPLVIDRPPVIRIDQAEIPNLVSLINVRHAGRRSASAATWDERIDRAEPRDLFRDRQEARREIYSCGEGSRTRATKSFMAASHCSLGWIQLVFIFASFSAFAM